jgi:hypothetical protein
MVSEATGIPSETRDRVIREVYSQAAAMGWQSLPAATKSAQYDRWAAAREVGGVLVRFMPEDRLRVWLKDGPLKEYGNAIHGLGRYGHLAPRLGPSPAQAAKAALGSSWRVVQGSERTKPLRFRAIGPHEQSAVVAYGPARKFKDLLWASLLGATEPETPCRVVVLITEPPAEPTPQAERDWHRKLARRCGLELKHFQFSDGR